MSISGKTLSSEGRFRGLGGILGGLEEGKVDLSMFSLHKVPYRSMLFAIFLALKYLTFLFLGFLKVLLSSFLPSLSCTSGSKSRVIFDEENQLL